MGPVTLVLFDIDGTLLLSHGSGRGAMSEAADDLFGCPEMFDSISFAGAVDSGIVAIAMEASGIPATGRRMGRIRKTYGRRLRRRLAACPGEVCPGVRRLVADLQGRSRVGLLTGNWEESARIKLDYHGLGALFEGCVGAYGSDATQRNALIPFAVRRARRRWSDIQRIIVVGDTPADIGCARAGAAFFPDLEVLAVAVETGFATPEDLAAATPDLQVPDLEQGREALLALV